MRKIMKRVFWMLGVMGVLSCMGVGMNHPTHISAAVVSDSESDDTIATANNMTVGDTVNGTITETDDLDYYKFTLDSAGCVTLNMTSYMRFYCIIMYDADGKEVWYTDWNEWNSNIGYRKDTYDLYLEKGIYYMQVNGYRYGNNDKSTGKYECSTIFLSSGVNNVESDNSFADANKVILGNKIIGQISCNDDFDDFSFEIKEAGCVTLNMTSYMRFYRIIVYDADGKEVWYTDWNEWNSAVGYRKDAYDLYLEKGIYYMQVDGYRYGNNDKSTGKYEIDTSFISYDTSFNGDDNSFATANSILWETGYIGQISLNDDFDTYKFIVSSGMDVPISILSCMKFYRIIVYDADGKEVWYTDWNEWNSDVGYRKDVHSVTLSAGTYYMQIDGYRYGNNDKSTGVYKFFLGGVSAQNPQIDVSKKDPTKNTKQDQKQETTKVSQTVKPSDSVNKPKKVKSVSARSKRKALKLKWKWSSDAAGYQICYSTSSKFKRKSSVRTTDTTVTLKNLKARKKYYVKIRAYSVQNGKKIYGSYSKVISKKTK